MKTSKRNAWSFISGVIAFNRYLQKAMQFKILRKEMHLCNFYSTCKSVEEIQKLRLKAKWKVVVVSTIA